MANRQELLQHLSRNESLLQQLRRGDANAFDKLNLSFDELYASPEKEDEFFGEAACGATCSGASCDFLTITTS